MQPQNPFGAPAPNTTPPAEGEQQPLEDKLPPDAQGVVNYKCPNCGGPLAFGIESQQWDCHFCGSGFAPADIAKLDTEQSATGEPETWQVENQAFEAGETVAYTCPSCGGSVLCEKNTAATFCVYCHSPTVVVANLSGEYRPAKLLPFKQTREQAVASLQKLCKGKVFLPKAFREVVNKGEVTGLYVPYWLYSADYRSMLYGTAQRVRTWRSGDYQYTRTDRYRVERGAYVPIHKVPVDASAHMDNKLMDGLEPFDYNDLAEFQMQYLSGHQAESYDEDSNTCAPRFYERATRAVEGTLRGMVNGYTSVQVHNVQHNPTAHDVQYVMLPVWTIMVPWKGKTYTFAMNGQTGKMVGNLPLSPARAGAWFGVITAVVTALALIGGLLL